MGTQRTEDSIVEVKPRYILVQTHSAPSLASTRVTLGLVDELLIKHRLRCVLFDTRATDAPSTEARDAWWVWVTAHTHHDRVAMLVESELTRISGNMTSLSLKTPVRSFNDLEEAEAWLLV